MLIRGATLEDGARVDVRVAAGRVTGGRVTDVRLAAMGRLAPEPGEPVTEADGGLLLPGLHDHHLHLAALAASRSSVRCGPPRVTDRAGLAAALAGAPGTGWLRGTGYHEGVAGLLDRATLDAMCARRPVRVQHRGGRMWFLNTAAMDLLLAGRDPPPGLDRASGRLFEGDSWLRAASGARPPALAEVGANLARAGITGVTDMTPSNDDAAARWLAGERAAGRLPQRLVLAGRAELDGPGPVKLHLHEADLPPFDRMVAAIGDAHARGRAAAVHCVTEVELVFTLAAFADAGAEAGDRIEHASLAPRHAVDEIARQGLAVVAQPHFVAERGDAYRRDVAAEDQPHLYRLRSLADAGVPLAAGSDAPFGAPDPWASMAAAVDRRTASGAVLGAGEALTPEEALGLYLADPADLRRRRRVAAGGPADLCLLDRPWESARRDLRSVAVRAAWIGGRPLFASLPDRVHQTPGERDGGADPPA